MYDGSNPYADFDGSGNLTNRYLYGPAVDMILARESAEGDVAWYLTDHLGTVRDIADTDGTVIDHIAYNSFGRVLSESSPSNGDRFKYTARELDPNGLYYYRARYYDAAIGRFLSEDPLRFDAGDNNLYRYVGNRATTATDPTGLYGSGGGSGGGTTRPPLTGMWQKERDSTKYTIATPDVSKIDWVIKNANRLGAARVREFVAKALDRWLQEHRKGSSNERVIKGVPPGYIALPGIVTGFRRKATQESTKLWIYLVIFQKPGGSKFLGSLASEKLVSEEELKKLNYIAMDYAQVSVTITKTVTTTTYTGAYVQKPGP